MELRNKTVSNHHDKILCIYNRVRPKGSGTGPQGKNQNKGNPNKENKSNLVSPMKGKGLGTSAVGAFRSF